jgi:hypothetical protein
VRSLIAVIPLLIGCGRLQFEQVADAPPADGAGASSQDGAASAGPDAAKPDNTIFGASCAVGLKLDEAAWTGAQGEIVDSCGADNNATAVDGALRVDDLTRGRVAEMPVPSGCLQISEAPSLHATTGLTLSAWIYPLMLDLIDAYGVMAKRNDFFTDDAEFAVFIWTDNQIWVDMDSRNDRSHGAYQVMNDRWQQITVVFDGTLAMAERVKIYVNGQLDASIPESSTTLTPYPSGLTVGCLRIIPNTQPQLALGGRIDDVGVWTRAFSAQEVQAWYRATLH